MAVARREFLQLAALLGIGGVATACGLLDDEGDTSGDGAIGPGSFVAIVGAGAAGMAASGPEHAALTGEIWWSRAKGGPGNGVPINHVYPINAQPLVGGQNWFDNVCRVKRVGA